MKFYRSGNLRGMEMPCRQLLRIAPYDSEAMFLLGLSIKAAGNPVEASRYFRMAADANAANVAFVKAAADELLAAGEFNQAVGYFSKLLRVQPGSVAIYNDIGHCYFALGKSREAIGYYRKALEINPDNAFVLSNLGNALLDVGRKKLAEAVYRKAVALKPDFAAAYYHLYPIIFRQDYPDNAISMLRKAVELTAGNFQIRCHLAMLLDLSGRTGEAHAIFDDLKASTPNAAYLIESWDYVKSHSTPITRLFALSFDALRFAFAHATKPGLILEFGVRNGTSINFLSRLTKGRVHGFDSFEGLPEEWLGEKKGLYSTGSVLPRVSTNVELHKGWFEDTLPEFAGRSREPVRFMNVDCDIYSSTRTIFECFGQQIVPGTVIIFDEYLFNPAWRNDEYKAFQELVAERKLQYEYLLFSLFSRQAAVIVR